MKMGWAFIDGLSFFLLLHIVPRVWAGRVFSPPISHSSLSLGDLTVVWRRWVVTWRDRLETSMGLGRTGSRSSVMSSLLSWAELTCTWVLGRIGLWAELAHLARGGEIHSHSGSYTYHEYPMIVPVPVPVPIIPVSPLILRDFYQPHES